MSCKNDEEVNIPELIRKKRDGEEMSASDIKTLIQRIVSNSMEPSQLGAFLMATYLKGMTSEEIIHLTKEMFTQGETLTWPEEWTGLMVDKHSTGGVGDKTSLILAPALAACGLKVPMISGRGLGFTGGTLDKLESIPGLRVNLSSEEIKSCLDSVGCCIVGQTSSLVPADKLMYACRDITGTIPSLPLIVSSIISKKAAENINALILDVKYGAAAFSKTESEARKLASSLVKVSTGIGTKTSAILSSMSAPLGSCIGNAIEVVESINALYGNAHPELIDLVCKLGGELLHLAGKVENIDDGEKVIMNKLMDGSARQKFIEMITFQGVDLKFAKEICEKEADRKKMLKVGPHSTMITSKQTGYVKDIDALVMANILRENQAGRLKASDILDYGIGIELKTTIGAKIEEGEPWLCFYHKNDKLSETIVEKLQPTLEVAPNPITNHPTSRILDIISQ